MGLPKLTIGIEEEYQIVDPKSRELRSYVQELLNGGRRVLADQIKPEFLKSQVEVGSRICRNLREARAEVVRLRSSVDELAASHGLKVMAASTHPFSSWLEQEVTEGERYTKHIEKLAEVARRMLIFAMHVHIGIDDRELMIDVMNQARYFLPHILALSTSSPLWHGRDTGLKSYRSIIFQSLPRNQDRLYRRADKDLVGHSATPDLPHPGVSGCRHLHPTRRDRRRSGSDPGDCRQADQAPPGQPVVAPLSAPLDHREQVARGALRPRRQADRFRPPEGGRDPAADP
jgi:hypothetical protein